MLSKGRIIGLFLLCSMLMGSLLTAQDDVSLLDLVEEEPIRDYAIAGFKTNHVINLHSFENTPYGVLDFKVSHRFGVIKNGLYDFFGLDNANTRIGFDYGLTENIQIGIGRSSFEKTYDGYFKWRFLRQQTGIKDIPLTMSLLTTAAAQTLKWPNPERDNKFWSRWSYTWQVIIGRKFSEKFSAQLSPTLVHRNLVATPEDKNDLLALGFGSRFKVSKRVSINVEYILAPTKELGDGYYNSFSIGTDIETGGHVFQLHLTNSTSMAENGFITKNTGSWGDGGVHFGFNISRVFTVRKRKPPIK